MKLGKYVSLSHDQTTFKSLIASNLHNLNLYHYENTSNGNALERMKRKFVHSSLQKQFLSGK